MLQNAYLLAKIGADTAENEQHFAEILPKIGNYPTGRLTGAPAQVAWLEASCSSTKFPREASISISGAGRTGPGGPVG